MIGSPSALLDILAEEWRADAACRYAEAELFDGLSLDDEVAALEYCKVCPVTRSCLEWVSRERGYTGIAGGKVWGRIHRKRARR